VAQAPESPDRPRDPPPNGTRHSDLDGPRQLDPVAPRHPDLLAAVVLHTLVRAGPRGITLARTIAACERDPASQADREEIETALRGLSADGLAYRRGARVRATRAALRADALSF
jgi:hypothetical protein